MAQRTFTLSLRALRKLEFHAVTWYLFVVLHYPNSLILVLTRVALSPTAPSVPNHRLFRPLVGESLIGPVFLSEQQLRHLLVQVRPGAIVADRMIRIGVCAPLHLRGRHSCADEQVDKCGCVLVVDVVVAEPVHDGVKPPAMFLKPARCAPPSSHSRRGWSATSSCTFPCTCCRRSASRSRALRWAPLRKRPSRPLRLSMRDTRRMTSQRWAMCFASMKLWREASSFAAQIWSWASNSPRWDATRDR